MRGLTTVLLAAALAGCLGADGFGRGEGAPDSAGDPMGPPGDHGTPGGTPTAPNPDQTVRYNWSTTEDLGAAAILVNFQDVPPGTSCSGLLGISAVVREGNGIALVEGLIGRAGLEGLAPLFAGTQWDANVGPVRDDAVYQTVATVAGAAGLLTYPTGASALPLDTTIGSGLFVGNFSIFLAGNHVEPFPDAVVLPGQAAVQSPIGDASILFDISCNRSFGVSFAVSRQVVVHSQAMFESGEFYRIGGVTNELIGGVTSRVWTTPWTVYGHAPRVNPTYVEGALRLGSGSSPVDWDLVSPWSSPEIPAGEGAIHLDRKQSVNPSCTPNCFELMSLAAIGWIEAETLADVLTAPKF